METVRGQTLNNDKKGRYSRGGQLASPCKTSEGKRRQLAAFPGCQGELLIQRNGRLLEDKVNSTEKEVTGGFRQYRARRCLFLKRTGTGYNEYLFTGGHDSSPCD